MAYGARWTWPMLLEGLWGDMTVEKLELPLWIVSGLAQDSRRAQNAKSTESGQRMMSLAAHGTEDEYTGCFQDNGELCFYNSPVEQELLRLDF